MDAKETNSMLAGRMSLNVKLARWRKAQRSTGSTTVQNGTRKLEQKARTSKKEWKWQRGIVAHPFSESQWKRGHFVVTKWESEKHKSWCMSVEGFKGHVATDGSLLNTAGKWGACGWAVVQLDYDEEMGPLHGMYGSMEAEFEVQRTVERAELTAFLCLTRKVRGPIKVHVDNKGIIDGSRKGEKECIKPRAGDADLWIKFWEENYMNWSKRGILVEVEHVKAHRTKKEKEKMTQRERFVTEWSEKADELAKAGAMLDEGFMAEARAETMKQGREEVYVALPYAASFHCLVEEWEDCEELKPEPTEK